MPLPGVAVSPVGAPGTVGVPCRADGAEVEVTAAMAPVVVPPARTMAIAAAAAAARGENA